MKKKAIISYLVLIGCLCIAEPVYATTEPWDVVLENLFLSIFFITIFYIPFVFIPILSFVQSKHPNISTKEVAKRCFIIRLILLISISILFPSFLIPIDCFVLFFATFVGVNVLRKIPPSYLTPMSSSHSMLLEKKGRDSILLRRLFHIFVEVECCSDQEEVLSTLCSKELQEQYWEKRSKLETQHYRKARDGYHYLYGCLIYSKEKNGKQTMTITLKTSFHEYTTTKDSQDQREREKVVTATYRLVFERKTKDFLSHCIYCQGDTLPTQPRCEYCNRFLSYENGGWIMTEKRRIN